MTEETNKLRLKFGAVEVEYEGKVSELKEQLPELLEIVSGYAPAHTPPKELDSGSGNVVPIKSGGGSLEATTNTIAAKLGCKDGADLIMAAALQLTLVQGKNQFTRKDLSEEMKTSSYHRKTYIKNLSGYLKTLVTKGFLNEVKQSVYSVHPEKLTQYEAQVA